MSQLFNQLIENGVQAGEITSLQGHMATVGKLANAVVGGQIVTAEGVFGLIRDINEDRLVIDLFQEHRVGVGSKVVMYKDELMVHPSNGLLGRVVDPLLHVLDDGPSVNNRYEVPVFAQAPSFSERMLLDQQLETGVVLVDTLFPVAMGQRIAVIGDSKSGKTIFTTQLAAHQVSLGRKVVIVMVAKRRADVEGLINNLKNRGAMDQVVVVVADSLASPMLSYLAPYTGAAMAEHLWYQGQDTVIIYDDLSTHAKIHREISLLHGIMPGRESYPGDMFYQHSSLLERAGRLKFNGATLTAFPILSTANNDITSYITTALISITDGQLIFDVEELQGGMTPPINIGLSVSRIGGRVQDDFHKDLAQGIFRALNEYSRAREFARFGQDLPEQYKAAMRLGDRLHYFLNQDSMETYSLAEQQIMLKSAFLAGDYELDIATVKANVRSILNQYQSKKANEAIALELVNKYKKESKT